MFAFLVIVLIAFHHQGGVDGGLCCQDGWISYKESCYLFNDTATLTWSAAKSVCSSLSDSYLPTIETTEEFSFLVSFANRLFKNGVTEGTLAFYVGANDMKHENHWVWDSNQANVPTSYWHHGQPDDAKHEEDCAGLYAHFNFELNDYPCNRRTHFICEKNLTEVLTTYEVH